MSRILLITAVLLLLAGAALYWSTREDTLTVYSSLPLQGQQRARSEDMVRAMRLALEHADGRAGRFRVRYVSLDDADAAAGGWAPGPVVQNAQRAAKDDRAAAYLGEFNSGASALSIPILSLARVPQISPGNTAVGLTSDAAGANVEEGEPGVYYPDGFRNYVRVVPRDNYQGRALASLMREDGCTKVAVIQDRGLYGVGLARNVRREARRRGIAVIAETVESHARSHHRSLAARVARRGADCAIFCGDTKSGAVGMVTALARALPQARLYGGDGISDRGFTDIERGGVGARVAARVTLTQPVLGPAGFDSPGAQRFFADFARKYPDHRNPDAYAIYSYEAMMLALDAIERSGSGEREDIVAALRDTRRRESVLGTYSIDANGDTTLKDFGLFVIEDGAPSYLRTIG